MHLIRDFLVPPNSESLDNYFNLLSVWKPGVHISAGSAFCLGMQKFFCKIRS